MKTKSNLKKIDNFRSNQELLRKKAIKSGVNLIAPETIFLSKDTSFGKNVTIEPYVVIVPSVKIVDNSHNKSFSYLEVTKIEKNVSVGTYSR